MSADGKPGLLIRQAELQDGRVADVRVSGGRITGIGALVQRPGERIIDAGGGLLLPGLHDHHAHIAATAASFASVRCGPPDIETEAALAAALSRPGDGWLRGIGYHESVGPLDRHWLDRVAPDRPVRVQHRSGRLWIFNTAGLEILLARGHSPPDGLERNDRGWTGRLFEGDAWLRQAMGGAPPGFAAVGAALAGFGVTGITDMTPTNGMAMAAHFGRECRSGALPQRVVMAGTQELGGHDLGTPLRLGPLKLHLHEARLPGFGEVVAAIRHAHESCRAAAIHCVTQVELVFAMAAYAEAGVLRGDRIEHASVATTAALEDMAELGLAVVTQPNFIYERGDAYRAAIAPEEWADLYRLRSVLEAGVVLAAGTDMPFGQPDPWAAMSAAVSRSTAHGEILGADERLTPEQALGLFLKDPLHLQETRLVREGEAADLCLLTSPWAGARTMLAAALVRMAIVDGVVVHECNVPPPALRPPEYRLTP